MEVYKFDKDFKVCIVPMPGDIVELDGTRLKVIGECFTGNPGERCHNCFLDNPSCYADIDQELLGRLCSRTKCFGLVREDRVDIHYEEVNEA